MSTLVANRIEKARRFAEFLTEHAPEFASPEIVEQIDETNWAIVASLMSTVSGRPENVPSPATRRLIVNQLRLDADTSGPFEGLPS